MAVSDYIAIINDFLSVNLDKVLLALTAVSLFTLVVFIFVNIKLSAVTRRYNQLMSGMEGKNLEELLMSHIADVGKVKDDMDRLKDKMQELEKEGKLAIKKIYMKRYNAFPDIGSDLSFSVIFLNDHNTGVLITSIYARDENRIYLKPIVNGSCDYSLSPEEKEIVSRAISG
ncbi:DUF4446 family protein [Biomaibacter acetigenes]|jgi:hypothetical protein|uniref:DUF4446 family protein n=1 Tax=Biomaibacter acetigenes TaxID=2316383 RepID=A0A3G2R996_9FIRM|nr:DUF4446 family protein [Biomaibacter acetigenes]AYO32114.1 DUF4446 family protein [Biomaibacter acetigenes]RKL64501.1 DUF4446 family protein [Thermoanaerobacteraceae bacterium SP2]